MKIAISTDGGYVSAHFGRCPAYTLVEIENEKVVRHEEIPNPGHSPGFLPDYLSKKGVNAIIAGGMGPRAQQLFAEKKIQTIIGIQGQINLVIEKFIKKELEAGQDLCDHSQHHEAPCSHEHSHVEEARPAYIGGKICITAKEKNLEAEVDPNFGRARYFLIVDPDTLEFEALENPYFEVAQGAGIQSAQFIIGQSVTTLLTGQVGPNAQRVLESAGIGVVFSAGCTVREAISMLKRR